MEGESNTNEGDSSIITKSITVYDIKHILNKKNIDF